MQRRDKMGFPVPLKEWFSGELRDFVGDIFSTAGGTPPAISSTSEAVLANFDKAERFSRKVWGLLSLELWHSCFTTRRPATGACSMSVRPRRSATDG